MCILIGLFHVNKFTVHWIRTLHSEIDVISDRQLSLHQHLQSTVVVIPVSSCLPCKLYQSFHSTSWHSMVQSPTTAHIRDDGVHPSKQIINKYNSQT